ncbi:MAG: ribonuclease HII [Candidatus Izimaplasma sp.]|nr:ribonuclease HII [Candidatus Izimaplasma bacterium]
MRQYETAYYQKGYHLIAGTDEVGRGPLAGPVVASAVMLDPDHPIEGLNDSKQLSAKKRDVLFDEIYNKAKAIATVFISPEEIDQINIYQASKKAMTTAILNLDKTPEVILSDAMPLSIDNIINESIIKGDSKSESIAAASIIAKVSRDRYMINIAKTYPKYGFEKHKGYPTKQHLDAIKQYGITPIHRKSYQPVKDAINKQIQLDI